MQAIGALETNTGSFQDISVKCITLPHPDISFMTKDLA